MDSGQTHSEGNEEGVTQVQIMKDLFNHLQPFFLFLNRIMG